MERSELIARLKRHDWFYSYTDDHRFWEAGEKDRKEIETALAELPAEEARVLFEENAPRQFKYTRPSWAER